jgi:L-lactate dehydrogenase complex protein LldG
LTGWGFSKDLPGFAGKTFRDRWNSLDKDVSKQIDTYTDKQAGNLPLDSQLTTEPVSLVSLFTQELTKVSGNIVHTTPNDLTNKAIDFLKSREIHQIHLEPDVLDESVLQKAGITVSHAPDAALRAGVTRAICGLADTGSVVVVDGEGYPLQASLLPEIHLAVLHASHILPSLADAMALPIVCESTSAVVITGPSRTGDIEMSHTIGVHGPGEVHVFLVHRTASTLVDD